MLTMLQSDLRSLSVESRNKHPRVREAADQAILQVRSLKQPEPGSESYSVGQFELVVRPLTMACKTREPKLALIAVGCLQKLIAQDAVPLDSLSAVLATLVDQAGTGDEGVQAKILQTVLSLLASKTYPVRRDDLSRAFSICLVLHGGSAASALINNTATATMRQAVSMLFERVGESGDVSAPSASAGVPAIGDTDSALSCAYLLVCDLCCLATGRATSWLEVKALDVVFVLELLELLLSSRTAVFADHDAMVSVLRGEICQLVSRLLGSNPPFELLHRTMRVAWSIVGHFAETLSQECSILLRQCVSSVLPRHSSGVRAGEPTRWDNEAPLWQRTLAMEVLGLICADSALPLIVSQTKMWPELLASLVLAIEYGLSRDKVFPSLAGTQRRVSLQLPTDTVQPNASAGHALSLGIGAMINLTNGFARAGAGAAVKELVAQSWRPVLQVLALVMERCNGPETVQGLVQVYVSLSETVAVLCMTDAHAAIISSMSKFTSAQGVPLSEKDVLVCDAMFQCITALRQELDTAAWIAAVAFFEQMDNILGDPAKSVGDGRVEKEHRIVLLSAFSNFYACTTDLGDGAFERMAHALDAALCKRLAARDVQYREAPLSLPRSFTIVCWPRMFRGGAHRFITAYAPIVTHLRKAAIHQNTLVSRLGVDALFGVIGQIMQQSDNAADSRAVRADQQVVLRPLSELSEAGSDDCRKHVLDGMYNLLESSGYELSNGWSLILSIIQGCAGSADGKVVASAFRCVQLIVTDFLSSMPVEHCQMCVVTVGRFRSNLSDMNLNLTAIGQLWNIADYFGREQDLLVEMLDKVTLGTGAASAGPIDPTPYPVADSTELDARAMAVGNDECHTFPYAHAAALKSERLPMDRLWRTLFAEMQLSCEDLRPEVRKCAMRTLMSTLTSHGDLFSARLWHELLWNTLFPVLASVHGAAVAADESKEGHDTVDTTLGRGRGQTAQLMMHHTRNTVSKQWDETRALALSGASRVFCRFFAVFQGLDSMGMVWKLLLEFVEASIRHRSAEVVTAGIEALAEMLSSCFGVADSASGVESEIMRKLWCDAMSTLSAVTAHVTLDLDSSAAPQRNQWIRMPISSGLSERSLQLFAACISNVYPKVWTAPWVRGEDVQHMAVAVDRLVHYSFRFEQTVSYVVVAGKEQSVMALSPTQKHALDWTKLVLKQVSDGAASPALHNKSTLPLLLLHCLRYLPGGATAVSRGGGHSLLTNSVQLESAEISFAVAKVALQLVLDFFGAGALEPELFVLAAKSLVCASTEPLDSTPQKDWSAFQVASMRGLLTTVRSGIAAHTAALPGTYLDVVCGELALVANAYICAGGAGTGGSDVFRGDQDEQQSISEKPIGIEVASCVTETLLSPAVQADLSKAVQRQLLEILDAGVTLLGNADGLGDATRPDPACMLVGRIPPRAQQALSATCLSSMFRVCTGLGSCAATPAVGATAVSPVTVAIALPLLFARCEWILTRYTDEAQRGGGMPVPRWQQDELERLLDLLCGYHAATEPSPDVGAEHGHERCSNRAGLVARLLPAMCAVSALGPGMLNKNTAARLATAVHLGFVSLGLEASFGRQ